MTSEALRPILKGTKSNFTLVHNISNVSDERVKDYLRTEVLVKEWVEQVLEIKIKEHLSEALKNGIVLCYLANAIQENIVPMITEKSKLGLEFKNNIDFFLLALKDLGFPKQKFFNLNDLYEGENIVRVVECLSSLSKFACSNKGFNIAMKPLNNNIPIKMPPPGEQLKKLKLQLSQIKDYTDKANVGPGRIGANVLKARMALLAGNTIDLVKCEKGFIQFQSLWRGFRVRQYVKKLKRDIAYREKVAQEILKTEEDYVKSLNSCIKGYMEPLVSKELINKEQQKLIFSDIQIIYNFGNKFLDELKKRCGSNWKVYQKLSDMFISISAFLKVYTSYVQNYNTALETLEELKKKDKSFLAALNELKDTSPLINGHDITSFLIQPVQRIPRYYMLLTDLVKHTWEDHPDLINLNSAAEKIKDVATFLNERKREGENFQKFTEIQATLIGKVPQLFTPSRRYIKQIRYFNSNSKSKQEIIVYLFNDVIIYGKIIKGIFNGSNNNNNNTNTTTSNYSNNPAYANLANIDNDRKVKYQGMIELVSIIIVDNNSEGNSSNNNSFEIRSNDKDRLVLLTIVAKNENEKNNLKNEINKLIAQIQENLRSKEQKIIENSVLLNGDTQPVVPEPTIEQQLSDRKKTMKKAEPTTTPASTTTTTATTTSSTTTATPLVTPRSNGSNSPSRNNSSNSISPPTSPEQSIPVSSFISSLFGKKKHSTSSHTSNNINTSTDSETNSNNSPNSGVDEAEHTNKPSPKQSRKKKNKTITSSPSPVPTPTSPPTSPSSTNSTTTTTTTTNVTSDNDSNNGDLVENSKDKDYKANRPRSKSTSRLSRIAGALTLKKRREKSQAIDSSQIPTSDDDNSSNNEITSPNSTPTKSPQNEQDEPSLLTVSTLTPTTTTTTATTATQAPSSPTPSSTNTTPPTSSLLSTSTTADRFSTSSSVSTNSESEPQNENNNNNNNTTYLPYDKILLQKNDGVLDPMKLESYLSNEEFKKVFNIERSEFLNYPKWKQNQKKTSLKLL